MNSKIDSLDQRSKGFALASLVVLVLPYFVVCSGFLFSDKAPIHDSGSFHYPAFQAIAESFKRDHRFPHCFWASGGTRLSYTHISLFHFIPQRWLGYLIYCLFPVSALSAYKLQLLLGMSLTACGWWLVLKRWFGSSLAACLGAQMILMGGTGITFHQEQVWSTVHLIPWFLLALQNLRIDAGQFVAAAAIFGLGLSTHQPQIQLLTMGLILIGALWYQGFAILRSRAITPKLIAEGLLLCLLGMLPSLYLFQQIDQLSSPIRGTEQMSAASYDEYKALNSQQISSAMPEYFKQYVAPGYSSDDRCSFFVGRLGLALALLGLLAGGLRALPVILGLVLFSLLSLGFNSPLPIPRLLFMLHFPFIGSFRQWFHFFPLVNFSLSILAVFGIMALRRFVASPKVWFPVLGVLLGLQTIELSVYCHRYIAAYAQGPPSAEIESTIFSDSYFGPARLFINKSRYNLGLARPTAIANLLSNQQGTFRLVEMSLSNQSLSLHVQALHEAELTVPLNYDLGWIASLDGAPAEIRRVDEALTGIHMTKGEHWITLMPVADFYGPIVLVQLLLYVWVLGRVLTTTWKNLFESRAAPGAGQLDVTRRPGEDHEAAGPGSGTA